MCDDGLAEVHVASAMVDVDEGDKIASEKAEVGITGVSGLAIGASDAVVEIAPIVG